MLSRLPTRKKASDFESQKLSILDGKESIKKTIATPFQQKRAQKLLNKSRNSLATEGLRTNNIALAKRNADLEQEKRNLESALESEKARNIELAHALKNLVDQFESARDLVGNVSQTFLHLTDDMTNLTNNMFVELPDYGSILNRSQCRLFNLTNHEQASSTPFQREATICSQIQEIISPTTSGLETNVNVCRDTNSLSILDISENDRITTSPESGSSRILETRRDQASVMARNTISAFIQAATRRGTFVVDNPLHSKSSSKSQIETDSYQPTAPVHERKLNATFVVAAVQNGSPKACSDTDKEEEDESNIMELCSTAEHNESGIPVEKEIDTTSESSVINIPFINSTPKMCLNDEDHSPVELQEMNAHETSEEDATIQFHTSIKSSLSKVCEEVNAKQDLTRLPSLEEQMQYEQSTPERVLQVSSKAVPTTNHNSSSKSSISNEPQITIEIESHVILPAVEDNVNSEELVIENVPQETLKDVAKFNQSETINEQDPFPNTREKFEENQEKTESVSSKSSTSMKRSRKLLKEFNVCEISVDSNASTDGSRSRRTRALTVSYKDPPLNKKLRR